MGYMPEQVQDFYPTPSTMSTCMYYTGVDPRTMDPVSVPKTAHEKALQRALIQYRKPENYDLVREALQKAGRTDLIGFGPKCLIRPTRPHAKRNDNLSPELKVSPGRRGDGNAGKTRGSNKRGGNAHGRNRAGQGREANRGGHRG